MNFVKNLDPVTNFQEKMVIIAKNLGLDTYDIEDLDYNLQYVKNVGLKNPTAYVLGYIATNNGTESIESSKYNKQFMLKAFFRLADVDQAEKNNRKKVLEVLWNSFFDFDFYEHIKDIDTIIDEFDIYSINIKSIQELIMLVEDNDNEIDFLNYIKARQNFLKNLINAPKVFDVSVKEADVVRYARMWSNIIGVKNLRF